jgi:uncharacterized protein (TIGR00369 family)
MESAEMLAPEHCRSAIIVGPQHLQPYGIVHGGVYSSLAEALASWGTHQTVFEHGMGAIGQSINVTFLRPVTEGRIHADARAIHRGRTSWVWDVEMSDDAGRLCATARMLVAVRPIPEKR